MAGSLIKIDEEIVSSAVASVTLGGSNWDSSYDVYMVQFSNLKPTTDNVLIKMNLFNLCIFFYFRFYFLTY